MKRESWNFQRQMGGPELFDFISYKAVQGFDASKNTRGRELAVAIDKKEGVAATSRELQWIV